MKTHKLGVLIFIIIIFGKLVFLLFIFISNEEVHRMW